MTPVTDDGDRYALAGARVLERVQEVVPRTDRSDAEALDHVAENDRPVLVAARAAKPRRLRGRAGRHVEDERAFETEAPHDVVVRERDAELRPHEPPVLDELRH